MNTTASRTPRTRIFLATAATASTLSLLVGCALPTTENAEAASSTSQQETTPASSTEGSSTEASDDPTSEDSVGSDPETEAAMTENHDYWTADDGAAAETEVQSITLDGDTASTESESVTVQNSTVTITEAGTYRISGSLEGQVAVTADEEDQVTLILDEATITNHAGPAILLTSADGVNIELAEGSTNTVADAESYAEGAEEDAAIFADTDLQITGSGALEVTGRGGDGIATKKDLVVSSGEITVTAAGHGLRGKDALVVAGGTLTVDAGGDALRSNNEDDADRGYVLIIDGTLNLTAEQDGIDAASDLLISGGILDIVSGGGASVAAVEDLSSKGLKAGVLLVVDGGETATDSADDALHSDGSIQLSSGMITAATGDDGAHAEHTLTIDGATVTVTESYEGLEASYLFIEDGNIDVTASDDGLNASFNAESEAADDAESAETTEQVQPGGGAGMGGEMGDDGSELIISGGTLTVDAEGDGIDSNGTLQVTGGATRVFGTTRGGNGAFDANGEFSIDGGTVVGSSAGSMEQTPASGDQSWVAASATGAAEESATVLDASGPELGNVTPTKDYGYIFYSDDTVTDGETYSVETAESAIEAVAGEAPAGGMGTGQGGGMPGAPEGIAPGETEFEQ